MVMAKENLKDDCKVEVDLNRGRSMITRAAIVATIVERKFISSAIVERGFEMKKKKRLQGWRSFYC